MKPKQVAPETNGDGSKQAEQRISGEISEFDISTAGGAGPGWVSRRIGGDTSEHARSVADNANTLPSRAVPSTAKKRPSLPGLLASKGGPIAAESRVDMHGLR